MFCPKCGNNNLDNGRFCTFCGNNLADMGYEAQKPVDDNQQAFYQEPKVQEPTVNEDFKSSAEPYVQQEPYVQSQPNPQAQYQQSYQAQQQYQQPYQQPYQQYQQYQQPYQAQPQYNTTQPTANKMSKEQFLEANPALKSKLTTATIIQTLVAIISIVGLIAVGIFIYLDYNDSYYSHYNEFGRWLENHIETWAYIIIGYIVIDAIVSVSLCSYAGSLKKQVDIAYNTYLYPPMQNNYYAYTTGASNWICPTCGKISPMHTPICGYCGTRRL